MRRSRAGFLLVVLTALSVGCGETPGGEPPGDPPPGEPGTLSFQEGAGGWSGAKSVAISDLGLGSSGNANGTSFGDNKSDWCIGQLHGASLGYDIAVLLRFDNITIPAGSKVTAAALELHLTNWERETRLVGQYLNQGWDADFIDQSGGTSTAPVGWTTRTRADRWQLAGGLGQGTDLIAGKAFYVPEGDARIPANGKAKFRAALHPEVVQQWVKDPSRNFGIRLKVESDKIHIGYVQPNRPAVDERPKLTIWYE